MRKEDMQFWEELQVPLDLMDFHAIGLGIVEVRVIISRLIVVPAMK